jgi:NAD(P)-dependent dehydrogenase (short-subunit alcohol dehydrogenase family)
MDRLKDKVAIVTGGGTGLGRAIAILYAEEGAKVTVADVRPADGEETVRRIVAAGGEALFVRADVSASEDMHAVVAQTEERFGRLNVMTANAGIMGRGAAKALPDIPEDEWWEIIRVNLGGVFYSFRHAIPAIMRAGGGAMTATSSLGADRAFRKLDAYAASKGGVNSMIRTLAYDLAPHIRVNAVAPGAMSTDLMLHMNQDKGVADPVAASQQREVENPVMRWSDPREVAHAHLFLASDDASFITGQVLTADAGWGMIAPTR